MDHEYRENGARNMYSNYNQMRAYVECSPNQSIKNIPYRPSHQAIDETLKILEKFLYLNIAVKLYQPTLIRWLSLLYDCVQIDNYFCNM